jgi:hypothetical protein
MMLLGFCVAPAQPVHTVLANEPVSTPLDEMLPPQGFTPTAYDGLARQLQFIPEHDQRNNGFAFRVHGAVGSVGFAPDGALFALPVAFPEISTPPVPTPTVIPTATVALANTPLASTSTAIVSVTNELANSASVAQPITTIADIENPESLEDNPRSHQPGVVQPVRLTYVGANLGSRITGVAPLASTINEYFGDQPEYNREHVTTFGAITYLALYSGIDLRYEGSDGRLKSTFEIAPGADTSQIRWQYQGASRLLIDPGTGDLNIAIDVTIPTALQVELGLLVGTTTITLTERAPSAWQEMPNGRIQVPVQFALIGENQITFALGSYDSALPLIIDPEIGYTAGGVGNETVYDMVAMSDGSVALVGCTNSTSFDSSVTATAQYSRVFVSRLNPSTGVFSWTTFYGDTVASCGTAIAKTSAESLVVTGYAGGSAFPVFPPSLPACGSGGTNIFASRLQGDGTMLTNRCLGGIATTASPSASDAGGWGIAVTSAPNEKIWITGSSNHDRGDFLLSLQPGTLPIMKGISSNGQFGAGSRLIGFLVRMSNDLSTSETRVYFGSGASTFVWDLALDSQNQPIVVGNTSLGGSTIQFPITNNAFQTTQTPGSFPDAFLARFFADGSDLSYSTLMGGTSADYAYSVAVGRDSNDFDTLYVTGRTAPTGTTPYPRSFATPASMDARAWQKDWAGFQNAFVVRLNPANSGASGLAYGTLIGSSRYDYGYSIAARQGIAYVVGQTDNTGVPIPLVNAVPFHGNSRGGNDMFMVALDTVANSRIMPTSGFFGDTGSDMARAVSVTSTGLINISGSKAPSTGTSQIYTAQINPSPSQLILSVTDANGQPVTGLTTSNGWPVLNASGSGVLANPLTVTAQVTNMGATSTGYLAQLQASSSANTARFWLFGFSPTLCSEQPQYATGNQYSLVGVTSGCDMPAMAVNETRLVTWKIWVQPSVSTQLSLRMRLLSPSLTLITEQTKSVTIPLARIRPVVVGAGIIGSGFKDGVLTLDPLLGTYEGILTNLRVLGYETGSTIVPFPYQWWGELRNPAVPNNVVSLAGVLQNRINTWWNGKTVPSYADNTRFDIVAHSASGLITREYVVSLGDQNKLSTVILVATSSRGAPNAYAAWEGADTANNRWVSRLFLRDLFKHWADKAGCRQFLGPKPSDVYNYIQGKPCQYGAQPGVPLIRDLLPTDESQNTTSGYPYLFRSNVAIPGPQNAKLNSLNATALVDQFVQAIDTGGSLYLLYSDIVATPYRYDVVIDSRRAPMWMNGNAVPTTDVPLKSNPASTSDLRNGDETVPAWSADLQLITSPSLRTAITKVLIPLENPSDPESFVTHAAYFNKPNSVRQILGRLIDPSLDGSTNNPWIAGLPHEQPVLPNILEQTTRMVAFWNQCPVTMLVTDSQGRRVGSLPNGQVVNEIPGALYTGDLPGNEPEYISIPEGVAGVYSVTVTGQRAEPFRITSEVLSEAGRSRLGIFTGTLQPGQTQTFSTRSLQAVMPLRTLLVDDGAGTTATNLYVSALSQLGRTPDTWNTAQQGAPTLANIYTYDSVIWVTGNTALLATAQLDMLGGFVTEGGTLLLAGQNVDAGVTNPAMLSETLRALVQTASTTSRQINGQDLLAGLSLQLNGGDSANNQTTPTSWQAIAGATALGVYTDGTGASQVAGVRTPLLTGRLVALGFGIEGVQVAATRTAILDRTLRWLENRPAPPAFPATSILDTFNRANGAVGSNWTGATSVFTIQSNALATTMSAGSTNRMVWATGFGANQEVYAKLSSLPSSAVEIDLVLKEADRGDGRNLLLVSYQKQSGVVQVWTTHNWGAWIQHGTNLPVTFQAGDRFGARAKADGTVEIYKNSTLVGTRTVAATWPHRSSGGRIGVWLIDAGGVKYDDFGGGTLP